MGGMNLSRRAFLVSLGALALNPLPARDIYAGWSAVLPRQPRRVVWRDAFIPQVEIVKLRSPEAVEAFVLRELARRGFDLSKPYESCFDICRYGQAYSQMEWWG